MSRGYTLVEMMVVLTIVAVMAGAAAPAISIWLDRETTPAEDMASLLRHARAQALATASPIRLVLDPTTGAWVLSGRAGGTSEGNLDLSGVEMKTDRAQLTFRFGPTGGADAPRVIIRGSNDSVAVHIDRWTGGVSLEEP